MRKLTRLVLFTMTIMLLIAANGCADETSEGSKVITSDDGFCQLEIPNDWSLRSDLNDYANIQAANLKKEVYVITISEYKIDFADDTTLESYSDITYQTFVDSLTDPVMISGPTQLEINGRRALQYEIRGEVEGVRAVCLHTSVDGEKGFHQVLAWTLISKYEKNLALLRSVIDSFREISY
jgi:hypothetical protein